MPVEAHRRVVAARSQTSRYGRLAAAVLGLLLCSWVPSLALADQRGGVRYDREATLVPASSNAEEARRARAALPPLSVVAIVLLLGLGWAERAHGKSARGGAAATVQAIVPADSALACAIIAPSVLAVIADGSPLQGLALVAQAAAAVPSEPALLIACAAVMAGALPAVAVVRGALRRVAPCPSMRQAASAFGRPASPQAWNT